MQTRTQRNESLEKFHFRLKQKPALHNWEDLEDSLVKSIFIQGMRNPQLQMDLLSEDRDPTGTLQYALARERGQESQQKNGQPKQIAIRHKPTRKNRNSIHKTQQHTAKKKHKTKNAHTTDTKIRTSTILLEMWI